MSADFPTVIAWSWGVEKYHQAAKRLKADCERLGYRHAISIRTDLTEHLARQVSADMEARKWIYRYIPGFIYKSLQRAGTHVLYLHADHRIRGPIPPEAWVGLDIGLESAWSKDPPAPQRILAAPIFVRNNDRARRFLRLWNAHCMDVDDGRSEHNLLHDLWVYLGRWDRTLRLGTFDPAIMSLKRDGETPIHGHK